MYKETKTNIKKSRNGQNKFSIKLFKDFCKSVISLQEMGKKKWEKQQQSSFGAFDALNANYMLN